MKRLVCFVFAVVTLWVWLTLPAAGNSDAREVDGPHSTMMVPSAAERNGFRKSSPTSRARKGLCKLTFGM
jgi:hypothetical protein